MESLRLRVSDLLTLKMELEKDLKKARETFFDNNEFLVIEEVFNEVFNPQTVSHSFTAHEDIPEKEKETSDLEEEEEIAPDGDVTEKENESSHHEEDQEFAAHEEGTPDTGEEEQISQWYINDSPEADNNNKSNIASQESNEDDEDIELDNDVLQKIEIIEYLNSDQAVKDMPDVFNVKEKYDDCCPSFSLGPEIEISQEDEENNGFFTPQKSTLYRSTREIKCGPYGKSPYIDRVTNFNSKYTNEDITLWRYMLLQKNDIL